VQRIYQQSKVGRVINLYGPTETTTYSSFAIVPRDSQATPPIGRPIANRQIYVLGHDMQPVPIGVPGEVYIGGVVDEQLQLVWRYSAHVHHRSTIEALAHSYLEVLQSLMVSY
jgi:hypothetical protein